MRLHGTTNRIGLAAAIGIAAAGTSHAQLPSGEDVYNVTNSAAVYVTPRGQERFSPSEIPKILKANDLDIHHFFFAERSHESKETTLDLDRLPGRLKPYQGTLNRVRDALTQLLFPHFDLKNPKINAVTRGIDAASKRLSLRIQFDPIASKPYGDSGVVLEAVLSVPDLKVKARDEARPVRRS